MHLGAWQEYRLAKVIELYKADRRRALEDVENVAREARRRQPRRGLATPRSEVSSTARTAPVQRRRSPRGSSASVATYADAAAEVRRSRGGLGAGRMPTGGKRLSSKERRQRRSLIEERVRLYTRSDAPAASTATEPQSARPGAQPVVPPAARPVAPSAAQQGRRILTPTADAVPAPLSPAQQPAQPAAEPPVQPQPVSLAQLLYGAPPVLHNAWAVPPAAATPAAHLAAPAAAAASAHPPQRQPTASRGGVRPLDAAALAEVATATPVATYSGTLTQGRQQTRSPYQVRSPLGHLRTPPGSPVRSMRSDASLASLPRQEVDELLRWTDELLPPESTRIRIWSSSQLPRRV
eukprot:TRINITY_DN5049_c0_g1_i1.p1 TRINITY_DN5049_c0_g1~~TRINITY_DN5049_c0_g1_i1.p1  ORF type:complete len:368 (+),score=103.58 TRINITY_DN5049_c0_g1_i1:52-1104(+)